MRLINNLFWLLGESLATRQAYGNAIVKLAKNNDRVVALDGDMKNSTFSQNLRKVYPERHVECFICEQNLAGVRIDQFNLFNMCIDKFYSTCDSCPKSINPVIHIVGWYWYGLQRPLRCICFHLRLFPYSCIWQLPHGSYFSNQR